jgi:hypothetical protein
MIKEFKLISFKKYWDCDIKFVLYHLIVLLLTSCENTYKANKNYLYTFSCVIEKDDYGRKVYGAHHFLLDEQIKDMSSFEECYVNYLEWSGLDKIWDV